MFKSILKLLTLVSLVTLPAQAQASAFTSSNELAAATLDPSSIRLIQCKNSLGTAVHIGDKLYMTAHHVIGPGDCVDASTLTPLEVIYDDPVGDFSLLSTPINLDNSPLAVSCEPFKTGESYYSVGWAAGVLLLSSEMIATDEYTGEDFIVSGNVRLHMRELTGVLIPGMSGGPMVDKDGVIHGINNVTNQPLKLAWSRELKDTILCK